MASVRKVFSRGAAQLSVSCRKPLSSYTFAQASSSRSFSSVLEVREVAEETRYIRNMEAAKQAAIRANIDRILALEDGHEEKEGLRVLLEEKKAEDKSIIARLGLNDWKFALPVGLFIGIPAISNEVIVIDCELQMTAAFILFCSTMYTQVGGMVAKGLEDYSKEIYEELKQVDNVMLEQINSAIEADKLAVTVEEDYKHICQLTDDMATVQADVLNHMEEHKYREAIVKKLDSLQALEESAVASIRNRMVNKVTTDVVELFKNDKKAKEGALLRAMEVLAAGANSKHGKDLVGEAFSASLVNYKQMYSKMPAGSDPILVQLEKDMAAVAAAPVVDSKGGNVFATHPLLM